MLKIYDYKQIFDSINLEEAISDIYNDGLNDDSLALIYKANKEIQMSVKTPNGLTKRQNINSPTRGYFWVYSGLCTGRLRRQGCCEYWAPISVQGQSGYQNVKSGR